MSEEFVERMVQSYHSVHTPRFWKAVTPLLSNKITDQSQVLDIGCGPGLHIKEIDRRFNPKKLIGVDLNPLMINRAKEILSDRLAKVEFVIQHLQEDPNLPEGNDVIFGSRVLRSFEDQFTSMRSIYSALNDNGLLVLLDWARADLQTYHEFLSAEPADVMKYHRNFSRYSLNDWEYILEHTGFKIELALSLPPVHLAIVARKV